MTDYVYPAIFSANTDGSYTVTYPNLPGCITEGTSLENAVHMAQSALTQWMEYLMDQKEPPPPASRVGDIAVAEGAAVKLVRVAVKDHLGVQ